MLIYYIIMSDPSYNIPATTNNVLKNTNIYGGLAILDNPTGSLGRLYVQRDAKIDGVLIVNDRLIDASFVDSIDTIPSVNDKILVATQNVAQQSYNYTDTKIAQLIGTASESLDSIQELATAVQNNASLVDSIYSVIGTKTTMDDVQTFVNNNYYNKSTIDTKLNQTIATAQTNTNQTVAPLITEINNIKTGLNQKITATDMANYVTQNTYSKPDLDAKFIDTLSQANQYTNSAIQNITGYETTTSVNTKLESLQLQINQKANINSPVFTGTVSGVSKGMVGLGNADNTSDVNKPISTATQNALNLKANLNSPTFTGTVAGITKAMVGLGQVDDTSDFNKPISNATRNALGLKANLLNPTFPNNVDITGTLNTYGNLRFNTDSTFTKYLSFNPTNQIFGYYRDSTVNVWAFDGSGNLFTSGGINTQASSTFNKSLTISETRGNSNLYLRSDTSSLTLCSDINTGGWNPINSDGDSLILYRNASVQDVGRLNICCWSNTPNGLQLTSSLTKVFGNFEVYNGSIVGSPIFRPTGNASYGLGDNVFNPTCILNPLTINGMTNGTANGASYSNFNLAINSWFGTGFVDTSSKKCMMVIDHRSGNIATQGSISLSGNINMNSSDIFARSIALSNSLFATNISANATATVGPYNVGNELRKLTNQNNYSGNINSASQSMTNGVSNVSAFTVTVPPFFKKQITVYVPISRYRTIDTNSTGTISETCTSITCSIFKNNTLWSSSPSYSLSTAINGPFTQIFTIRASGLFLSYDSFIATATVTFTPDVASTSDSYVVAFTYNGSVSSNFPFTTRTYGITTNTLTSGVSVSNSANISPTIVNAITTGYRSAGYTVNYILPTNTDGTITEVSQNLTTNTILSQSINTNTLVAPLGIACFMLDGTATFSVWPFCCTTKGINPQGADDHWIVNAGYAINIYSGNNYTGSVYTLDNTNGTAPQRFASTPANNARSIQVYFKYNEISFPVISY